MVHINIYHDLRYLLNAIRITMYREKEKEKQKKKYIYTTRIYIYLVLKKEKITLLSA
jgi:hypothetical protein